MVGDGNNDKMTKKDFISKMGNLGVYCSIQFINVCDKIVSIGEKIIVPAIVNYSLKNKNI